MRISSQGHAHFLQTFAERQVSGQRQGQARRGMQARARHFGRQFHNALRLHGGLAFGPEHTQMVAVHVGPLHLAAP